MKLEGQLNAHKLPNYYFTSRSATLQSNCNFGTAKLVSSMTALSSGLQQQQFRKNN